MYHLDELESRDPLYLISLKANTRVRSLLYYAKQDKNTCGLNLIVGNDRTTKRRVPSENKNRGKEQKHREER